jgi:hypothetical protein
MGGSRRRNRRWNAKDTQRCLIPPAYNVLSFKVQPDGGMRLYLQPVFFAGNIAQSVQAGLNDLVR